MSSKTLGNLMRVSVIAAAICGQFLCAYIIPVWGWDVACANPEFAGWFWPWLIFAWAFSIPCFAILYFVWRVSGAVYNETVFTMQTANWVKAAAVTLLCGAELLFVGNVVLFLLNMNHPGILLMFMAGDIFIIALVLFAAVLARYITKAAVLQEESEGTL